MGRSVLAWGRVSTGLKGGGGVCSEHRSFQAGQREEEQEAEALWYLFGKSWRFSFQLLSSVTISLARGSAKAGKGWGIQPPPHPSGKACEQGGKGFPGRSWGKGLHPRPKAASQRKEAPAEPPLNFQAHLLSRGFPPWG